MSTAPVEPHVDMFADTCACLIRAAEQYRENILRGREASEAALLAARRAGAILATLDRAPGKRNDLPKHASAGSDYRKAIAGAQISERTAETWQEVAAVPDHVFNEYLTGEDDGERIVPSIRGLLTHAAYEKLYEDEEKAAPEEPEVKKRFRAWRRKAGGPKARPRVSWDDFHARHNLRADSTVTATLLEVWKAASNIVETGYRTLAKSIHPDHNGDAGEMASLNLAVEQLRLMVQAKQEGF
jgi:hypothetical protein